MEVVGRITLVGVNTTTDHIQMGFNLGHQPGEERKHLITVDGCKQDTLKLPSLCPHENFTSVTCDTYLEMSENEVSLVRLSLMPVFQTLRQ